MDARIDPAALLKLEPGDAHVIRNAGGLVTRDVIRSLALSQAALGTRDVILILHTDCGLNSGTESTLRQRIEERLPAPSPISRSAPSATSTRRCGRGAG